MSNSSATAVCPKCGRALPSDAPRGLCVKCLFAGMLEVGPLDALAQSTSGKASCRARSPPTNCWRKSRAAAWASFIAVRANAEVNRLWD